MKTISLYEVRWDIEVRAGEKPDWINNAVRVVTTRVSDDIFDTIMTGNLETAKWLMRMIYRDLNNWLR